MNRGREGKEDIEESENKIRGLTQHRHHAPNRHHGSIGKGKVRAGRAARVCTSCSTLRRTWRCLRPRECTAYVCGRGLHVWNAVVGVGIASTNSATDADKKARSVAEIMLFWVFFPFLEKGAKVTRWRHDAGLNGTGVVKVVTRVVQAMVLWWSKW